MANPYENQPADGLPTRPAQRASRLSALVLGGGLGLLLGLVLVLAVLIWRREPSAPAITRADLAAAEQRWADRGPKSYDMDIAIGGRQPGEVHIEVRDNKVARMTRDGVRPSQERTWVYWTVPEQFETIRQDFDSAEAPGGFGAPTGSEVLIKAEFDRQYGYPQRYQRFVLGTDLNVSWETRSFTVVAETNP